MFLFHFSSEYVQSVGKEFWRVLTRCNSIWRSSFCCSNPRRTWAIQALVHLQTRPTLQSWALSFAQKTDKNKDTPLNFNTNFVIAEATLVKLKQNILQQVNIESRNLHTRATSNTFSMSPWKAVSKSSRSTAGNLSTTGIKKKQLNCTFQQNRMDMSILQAVKLLL